ncbi:putative transcriptional regulator [Pseudomonas aeruginosa]|nr:putative transcriptional regulator [Pseudomonas aeruginosa]
MAINLKEILAMNKLDRYDLRILEELQRDARISNQELAERIGLSPSPCSRRVKQLEDDGYIVRQVALLDRKKLGLSLTAFVLIGMDRHTRNASNISRKSSANARKCWSAAWSPGWTRTTS